MPESFNYVFILYMFVTYDCKGNIWQIALIDGSDSSVVQDFYQPVQLVFAIYDVKMSSKLDVSYICAANIN